MFLVKFVDIGEGLHEGRVVAILKKVGERVEEGEALFSVETAKVTSDIPSPVSGVVAQINITEGQEIHVGETVFLIEEDRKEGGAPTKEKEEEAKEEAGASVVGSVKISNSLLDFAQFKNRASSKTKTQESTSRRARRLAALAGRKGEAEGEAAVPYTGKVSESFDVIVVGGGPGGYLAAELAAKAKLKTLLVEKEFLGGVCLNMGCIPTKTLLHSTEIIQTLQKEARDFGVVTQGFELDWEKAQKKKEEVVGKLQGGVKGLLAHAGVKVIKGEASFVGSFEVSVNSEVFRGTNIILATGSLDKKINFEGFYEGYQSGLVITSREALLESRKLPEKIVIIGGGVIGCEMAQIYASFGHKVKIIHAGASLLSEAERELVEVLAPKLTAQGVEVVYNALPNKLDVAKKLLTYNQGESLIEEEVEVILSAIGRYPVNAQVDKVGVKLDAKGAVVVDEFGETNIKGFYAVGDCNGVNMLAHAAYRQAVAVVNSIKGQKDSFLKDLVPSVVYTKPEIASVGVTEESAKREKREVVSAKFNYSFLGRGISNQQEVGFCKLIADKETGEVLGAQIVGASASDLISEVVVAIASEATVFELAKAIHPHPSFSEIIWETARLLVQKLLP